jgi:acetolactate synthase-1/2/3 large subunit
VFLEIPWDVLVNGVDDPALPSEYLSTARPAGDPAFIDRAAAALARAERAVIVAGSSVWWDDAVAELRTFAERVGAPVFLNGAGRGCLPSEHPLSFQFVRRAALSEADVAVVLGTPLDFRMDYGDALRPEATLIQVDTDPAELGRNRACPIGLWGDTKLVLRQLVQALGSGAAPAGRAAFVRSLRQREDAKRDALAALEASPAVPIHHSRLAREISDFANAPGRDPIFVADGGNYVAMAAKTVRLPGPGRWLDPGPLGCLGVGAPFAIAAKLLHPERQVVVLEGDGSFGFNGFDFETAVRFGLAMVVVVGNDAAWGQIRLPQVSMYGEALSPATRLAATRYDRVVEALGGRGFHVDRPDAIRPALEEALASGTVACVDVAIDPDAPLTSGMMGYAI